MYRKVTSSFRVSHIVSEELYEAYVKAAKNLRDLERSIQSQFMTSPEGKILWATGTGGGHKCRIEFGDYAMLHIEHYANFVEPAGPSRVVDPPLLNTLLHTKLLTDEEKRSLLEEQGILKSKEVTPTPEA